MRDFYKQAVDEWISVGHALLDAAVPVTHNSDGDELEGCLLCSPDRPFTHRDNCPIPDLEFRLRLRRQPPAGYAERHQDNGA